MALGVAVAACLASAPEAVAEQGPGPVSPAAAVDSLAAAEAALDPGPGVEPAADPSVALNELAVAVAQLEGTQRVRAEALLARPTDGAGDQYGDGYPDAAPVVAAQSAHFCTFFVNNPGFADAPDLTDADGVTDGDGVPDYVERILEIAEFSRAAEVTPGPLGWQPPKPDADGCGADPSQRSDLYLKQLGNKGYFGYESPDPGQGNSRSQYGYMVLDDDYASGEYGFAEPLDAARVTFAHEFNHLLQQRYDSFQDTWLFESTAVWVEEQVYPEINDYVNYVDAFASKPGAPITKTRAADGLKIYGSGVWNHWLSGPGTDLGVASVRRVWEVSGAVDPASFAIAAYDRAIADSGGRSFSRELLPFFAATAEWRTGYGGFPDASMYPDVKRKGSLRKGRSEEPTLDHTAYRLIAVDASGGEITLKVRAEDGVRTGLALVARDGAPTTGTVVKRGRYLAKGGTGRVTLESPGRFERITAVVANVDGRAKGFGAVDWLYRKDDRRFIAKLR